MALREEGYWDDHYQLELRNYNEDGDEGEIWFGKALSRKIIDWIINRLSFIEQKQITNIIDVGCGNAHLLYSLVDRYNNKFGSVKDNLKITGIDYSNKSIELSTKIIFDNNYSKEITLKQCDFLDNEQLKLVTNGDKFDFIIDKGTFDAICLLNGKSDESLATTKLKFIQSLYSLIKDGSIFILASCNHTQEELMTLFSLGCSNKINSKLIDKIETPKIQFGGKEGSQVTCLIIEFTTIIDEL